MDLYSLKIWPQEPKTQCAKEENRDLAGESSPFYHWHSYPVHRQKSFCYCDYSSFYNTPEFFWHVSKQVETALPEVGDSNSGFLHMWNLPNHTFPVNAHSRRGSLLLLQQRRTALLWNHWDWSHFDVYHLSIKPHQFKPWFKEGFLQKSTGAMANPLKPLNRVSCS